MNIDANDLAKISGENSFEFYQTEFKNELFILIFHSTERLEKMLKEAAMNKFNGLKVRFSFDKKYNGKSELIEFVISKFKKELEKKNFQTEYTSDPIYEYGYEEYWGVSNKMQHSFVFTILWTKQDKNIIYDDSKNSIVIPFRENLLKFGQMINFKIQKKQQKKQQKKEQKQE